MIIFIHGEDTFRSRKFLKEQVEEFKKKRDPNGLNIVFIDGKNEKGENIFREIKKKTPNHFDLFSRGRSR